MSNLRAPPGRRASTVAAWFFRVLVVSRLAGNELRPRAFLTVYIEAREGSPSEDSLASTRRICRRSLECWNSGNGEY